MKYKNTSKHKVGAVIHPAVTPTPEERLTYRVREPKSRIGLPPNWKMYAALAFVTLVIACILMYAFLKRVNAWYVSHELVFNRVVSLQVNKPFEVRERKAVEVVERKEFLTYPEELIDTPIKKYICEKFGPLDCKTALAIVETESGFNDQAIGINTNNTVDLGCWQINSIHFKGTATDPIDPKDALDCHKATDWAYAKFKRDGGFGAWVAYTTGKYLSRL